jgi:Mg2+ and Co2+ transporter CorA
MVLATIMHSSDAVQSLLTVRFPQLNIHFPQNSVTFDFMKILHAEVRASGDVYDHAMRINEMADTLREVLATALDANLSVISVSRNKDTKRLAAWAAIIAAPTAIGGIYGMTFKYMPELSWRFGYFVVFGAIAVVCSGLWLGFKRSGWL